MIKAILTDIEGTTSSISFVHEVLFPYAASRMHEFVMEHAGQPEVREQLDEVAQIAELPADDLDALSAQLLEWIREDRKITPLKSLQGMIWAEGYAKGDFKGHVYPDAHQALAEWHRKGLKLYVYSSGSVAAQKLIFGHTDYGDMTPLFSGYFDTRVGGKREPESYQQIAEQIALAPDAILFLSDVPAELDAAALAGMRVCQLVRQPDVETQERHPAVVSFADVRTHD